MVQGDSCGWWPDLVATSSGNRSATGPTSGAPYRARAGSSGRSPAEATIPSRSRTAASWAALAATRASAASGSSVAASEAATAASRAAEAATTASSAAAIAEAHASSTSSGRGSAYRWRPKKVRITSRVM